MPEKPARLMPVTVPKPWGREVWYSGIEQRGESRVATGGCHVPLGQFLRQHGRERPVILLKTLHPDDGDLYVEVHATKHEVYVVDALDSAIWGKRGQMLLGAKRGDSSDVDYRARLLQASQDAESTGSLGAVHDCLEAKTLSVGDAVAIPPGVPHCLHRGVSVIEFQTPLYERKILAASHPVVTQTSWDGADAVAQLDLAATGCVSPETPARQQTLGRAATFTVARHRLDAGDSLFVGAWSIGWVAQGRLHAGNASFDQRQAWIAPAEAELTAQTSAEVLLAQER